MANFDDSIKKILQKKLKIKKINKPVSQLKFGSLKGWDSLNHFQILLEVEKEFKIKFTTEIFTKIKSILDIKKYIKENEKKNN